MKYKNFPRITTLFVIVILYMLKVTSVAMAQSSIPANQHKVDWTGLEYKATVFFVTATSSIKLDVLDTDQAQKDLVIEGGKDVLNPRQQQIFRLNTFSDEFGKKTSYQLWFDGDGTALQKTRILKGNKNEVKVYRYAPCGYYRLVKKFKNDNFDSGFNDWKNIKASYKPYKNAQCEDVIITDSNALLYLVPSLDFKNVGDSHEFLVESSQRLVPVKLSVKSKTAIKADYQLETAEGKTRVYKSVDVLKIQLQPVVNSPGSDNFSFLGLKGNIDLYVDMKNRMILRLSGKLDVVGSVDINLSAAKMAH